MHVAALSLPLSGFIDGTYHSIDQTTTAPRLSHDESQLIKIKNPTRCVSRCENILTPRFLYATRAGNQGQQPGLLNKRDDQFRTAAVKYTPLSLFTSQLTSSHPDHDMRRLCLVVTAVCSLLLGYVEPHADVFQATSANLRAPRLSETTIDRRRLKSQLSGEHTTASNPQPRLISDTTQVKSGTSEERAPWNFGVASNLLPGFVLEHAPWVLGIASNLLPDFVLQYDILMYYVMRLHPTEVYEELKLQHSYADRRALPLWLQYIQHFYSDKFSYKQALDDLMTNREAVEAVKFLLPYRKGKGVDTEVNVMLKLAIGRISHGSDELAKVMLDLEVSAAEALDLFGLNTKNALAKAPDLAITWLKFTQMLKKKKRVPPLYLMRNNPLFVSREESVNLLLKGKKTSTLDAFIKKVAGVPELEDFVSLLRRPIRKKRWRYRPLRNKGTES